jgi:hypothetical protein
MFQYQISIRKGNALKNLDSSTNTRLGALLLTEGSGCTRSDGFNGGEST